MIILNETERALIQVLSVYGWEMKNIEQAAQEALDKIINKEDDDYWYSGEHKWPIDAYDKVDAAVEAMRMNDREIKENDK